MRQGIVWIVLLLAGATTAGAQPNFAGIRQVGNLTVFPDAHDALLFYYVPAPIGLETRNGVPLFDFLQTRYTGTSLRGDQGEFRTFSQVTLSVETDPMDADLLMAAARRLGSNGRSAELRPVPLSALDADLVYALPGSDSLATVGSDSIALDQANGRWFDKTFMIRLTDAGSQALWQMLQEGRTILSFAYAYVATGVDRPFEDIRTGGTISDPQWDADSLLASRPESGIVERVVFADAFDIELNPTLYPEHFTRVDLNGDRVPPGYAALAVRCYDFKDDLRDDLWEKQLEIEAESVSGRPARISMQFSVDNDRIYKYAARFPYAVRLDKPYRYRVTEISVDGDERVGEWIERHSWVEPLDITTPYERLAAQQATQTDEYPEE